MEKIEEDEENISENVPTNAHLQLKNLIYFKNDILKDVRAMEEKLNTKFLQQRQMSSEQYSELENKLDKLSTLVSKMNYDVLNNVEINEKIKTLQIFKSVSEDKFNRLNSKMAIIQKECKESLDNVEKLVNDNLRYPGVIGKNAKFANFKKFIDYIINQINTLNKFKDEIINVNFKGYKNKIYSDIQEIRAAIIESSRNSVQLVVNNFKEFDKRTEKLLKVNSEIIKENENDFTKLTSRIRETLKEYQEKFATLENIINDTFENKIKECFTEYQDKFVCLEKNINESFENKIKESLSDYHDKFSSLVKNINDKYDERIKEIENLKEQFIQDINDVKSYLKRNETTEYDNRIYNFSKIIDDNYEENNRYNDNNNQNHVVSRNINYKTVPIEDGNNYSLINDSITNENTKKIYFSPDSNINIMDNFQNEFIKKHHSNKKNNIQKRIVKFKTFDKKVQKIIKSKNKVIKGDNNDLENKNTKLDLSFIQEDMINNNERINPKLNILSQKDDSNNYFYSTKKELIKNNYSVTNIPNISIRKVNFPDYINRKNKNNRNINKKPNNISSSINKRTFFRDDYKNNKIRKNFLDKSNKNKEEEANIISSVESAKIIIKKKLNRQKEFLDSFRNIKNKDNNELNSYLNIRKRRNSSSEKGKSGKDEKIQVELKKTFYGGYKIGNLLLNHNNFKQNRKNKS